ncbi:MAG: ribonuclease HII [Candidatus Parcubacteria bacterium]|nr:MAG: ribonuclease HII [Candidatus Parcubacteria bacterium]
MKYLIGIDEVGRGALAGPVFISAVLIPKNLKIQNKKLGKLFDSKKLNPKKRFLWYKYLISHPKIKFYVSKISHQKIDKLNISNAANLGAYRALTKLLEKNKINLKNFKIFLDGGLYLKSKDYQKLNFLNTKTIIKADEKYQVVKMASIIAKVQRDEYMKKLAKKYPNYFFEKHKGYGTKIHLTLIKKYGPSMAHRLTFI